MPPMTPPSASIVDRVAEELTQYTRVTTLTTDLFRAHEARLAAEARLAQLDRAIEHTHRTFDAFDAALAKVYRSPDDARIAFLHLAHTRGVEHAVAVLRDTPGKLAEPMTTVAIRDHTVSVTTAGTTTELATSSWRALDALHAARYGREAAFAASIEGRRAYNAQDAAATVAYTAQAKRFDTVFRSAVDRLYADPVQAYQHVLDDAANNGADLAAHRLRTTPEVYGALRSVRPEGATAGPQHSAGRHIQYLAADAGLAWADAELHVGAEPAHTPLVQAALDRAIRTERRFDRRLAESYLDPVRARVTFRRDADRIGVDAAVQYLYTDPARFGPLRTQHTPGTASESAVDRPETIPWHQATTLAARGRADAAAQAQFRTALWRDTQRTTTYAIRDALEEAFENPAEAWRRLTRLMAERGTSDAITRLQDTPTWFGTLRTDTAGQQEPMAAVREAANQATHLTATTPAIAEVRGTAWQHLVQTRAEEGQIRVQLGAMPAKDVLERSIAVAVHHMTPAQRAQLHHTVLPSHGALAEQLAARVRELVLGAARER